MTFSTFIASIYLILLTFLSACGIDPNQPSKAHLKKLPVIFGEDDRQRVSGARTPLDRAAGLLVGQNEEGKATLCSAMSIKNDYILTAAHCLYSNGQVIKNVYFYPSIRVENIVPFGRFPVLNIIKPDMFNKNLYTVDNLGFDIALAKVGPNADGKTLTQIIGGMGWWGLKQLPLNNASTIGYPGDKPRSSAFYQDDCFIDDYNQLLYHTECDVYQGQSGSPILMQHQESNNKFIIGVIVGETSELNLVAKITPERQKIIDAITQQKYIEEKNLYSEKWSEHKIPLSRTVNILVLNKCQEDVYVAYTAQDMEKNWKTAGFIKVKPHDTIEITRTPNRIYRLHAHIGARRKVVIGHEYSSQVPGSSGYYKFAEFRESRFDDKIHSITNCN